MPVPAPVTWMDTYTTAGTVWFIKRLSANDTQLTGGHQAGFYVPKDILFVAFPELQRQDRKNPRLKLVLYVASHGVRRCANAIWYNNRLHGGTRNETRITGFRGRSSPFLDPENTGALALIAFHTENGMPCCDAWVCRNKDEEECIEDRLGPVEPGRHISFSIGKHNLLDIQKPRKSEAIPEEWLTAFPAPRDVVRRVIELDISGNRNADKRLIYRRKQEYQLFQDVEAAIELPLIREGFDSMDGFISQAQRILQRRKARAGRSLELHTFHILEEEGLSQDVSFSYQPVTGNGQQPDFIFPSIKAYQDAGFPEHRLRMLAVKTSCRDRWRQILQEADRIKHKHLLTLQEGISQQQFRQMQEARVQLVVPEPLHRKFPHSIRSELMTVENFIGDLKILS